MTDAGILVRAPETQAEILGYVEGLDRRHVSGWVWRRDTPNQPVAIEVIVDGKAVVRCIADRYRADLAAAGVGEGYHSFVVSFPPQIQLIGVSKLSVRIVGTEIDLPWVPGLGQFLDRREALDGVGGWLDVIAPHAVQGWVRRPPSLEPVPVQVYCRAELLLETAVTFSDDTLLDDVAPFELELPLHDAQSAEEIRVMAEVNGAFAPLPRPQVAPGAPWAGFEVRDASTVLGWVAQRGQDAASVVEVLLDGHIAWQGPARRLMNGHSVGFKVDLPEPQNWDAPIEVSARLADCGRMIGAPIRIRPIERFIGNVDSVRFTAEKLVIAGWVHDKARPLDPLEVTLYLGDAVIADVRADEFREDLKAEGYGIGRHGFTLICPVPGSIKTAQLSLAVGNAKVFPVVYAEEEQDLREGSDNRAVQRFKPNLSVCNVDGSIDNVRYTSVSGWARYQEAPDEPVLLDLFIDNSYYYSTLTGRYRADVGTKFGDHGNHGFFFELPPHIVRGEDLEVRVVPRRGKAAFASAPKLLRRRPNGLVLNQAPALAPVRLAPADGCRSEVRKIAYIVLNLNGGHLLEELLRSFQSHNRYDNYEIIIIDHGSEDGSLELARIWANRLNIKILDRGENYSFSASNNFGAAQTDADILVFLNNDIVFTQDVASVLVDLLNDESIGLVGIKLLDSPSDTAYAAAPIQHLGVHFHWMHRQNLLHPFETRYAPQLRNVVNDVYDVPAVTGALLACRRDEFLGCGGLDEGYFYGYEDVDLCLRYGLDLGKRIVCANNISAYHVRGYSRGKVGPALALRLAENSKRLQEKYGKVMRRRMTQERFTRPGFWTAAVPRIAFAVTEASDLTAAGDYFTALELAQELAKLLPCQVVFLDKRNNWFDVAGVDVLITMCDDYDLRKLQNVAPHLLKVGWARNWIDRWADREWAQDYDVIWASSEKASSYLTKALARPIEVVRIATSPERFQKGSYKPALASDYCFTGSYFGAPREIVYYLDPAALPFEFAVYGHGWEEVSRFAPYSRGPLPYSVMPNVYASTKIVIDDANSATKQWGSVNSRVFDALAAGALVITNGRDGAAEAFDGLLPSYSSTQELEELLWRYLSDEETRIALVGELQRKVCELYTYSRRAEQVIAHLQHVAAMQLRFAIKIGTPREDVKEEWGDYHFALGLKRALTRLGHTVRIDCLNRWEGDHCLGDDVVIVLRGLSQYEPKPHQVNLMWNISHPDAVSKAEYELYDHVFVASERYAKELSAMLEVPVSPLLQCTDPEIFNPDVEPLLECPGYLFVGNSRNVYREVVKYCIELDVPIEIHGTRWEGFVPGRLIKSTNIPNKFLGRYYKSSNVILNDHWRNMRDNGFISNRLFDALATGACVITDYVEGMQEIFGLGILTFASRDDFRRAIESLSEGSALVRSKETAQQILRHHTFDQRASEILKKVFQYLPKMHGSE